MMRAFAFCFIALLATATAQAQTGIGAGIGTFLRIRGAQKLNDAQMELLQQQAEQQRELVASQQAAAASEQAAAEQQQQFRQIMEAIRAKLEQAWLAAGFQPDMAKAVAASYQVKPDASAVWISVRGESDDAWKGDVRKALADRDYQLADELVVGRMIASNMLQVNAAPATNSGH